MSDLSQTSHGTTRSWRSRRRYSSPSGCSACLRVPMRSGRSPTSSQASSPARGAAGCGARLAIPGGPGCRDTPPSRFGRRALAVWYDAQVDWISANVSGIFGRARIGGAGAPIVLVHGLAVSSRYFLPLASRLVRRRAVVAPDLPGHGRSGTPEQPLTITELADALLEWLDIARIDSAPLVANSLGCQVAVDLAVRVPERVGPLVLIGPTMDPSAPTLRAQAQRLAQDALREPLELTIAELRDYVRMGPRRIVASARNALDDPFAAKVKQVHQPTLVIRGERDPIVSQGWAEQVARLLPDGQLAVVARAPHVAHWVAADEVARLIEEFT